MVKLKKINILHVFDEMNLKVKDIFKQTKNNFDLSCFHLGIHVVLDLLALYLVHSDPINNYLPVCLLVK